MKLKATNLTRSVLLLALALIVTLTAGAADNSSNATASPERPNAGASSRAPFSAFKIITATNIFNTKRYRNYVSPTNSGPVRYRAVESFGLVGVMTYDKGPFAFFEGSGSDYQKVLKPDETIAGFKVGAIQQGAVKLISPTNELELKVGMQLTRVDGGAWQLGERPENLDSRVTFNAQPAARREEQPQQDAPPFGFPPPGALQNLPDSIQQAIANGLQNAGQGGGPQVNIQTPTGNAVITTAPATGATGSEDVLRRLILRRQQQEQGN